MLSQTHKTQHHSNILNKELSYSMRNVQLKFYDNNIGEVNGI